MYEDMSNEEDLRKSDICLHNLKVLESIVSKPQSSAPSGK